MSTALHSSGITGIQHLPSGNITTVGQGEGCVRRPLSSPCYCAGWAESHALHCSWVTSLSLPPGHVFKWSLQSGKTLPDVLPLCTAFLKPRYCPVPWGSIISPPQQPQSRSDGFCALCAPNTQVAQEQPSRLSPVPVLLGLALTLAFQILCKESSAPWFQPSKSSGSLNTAIQSFPRGEDQQSHLPYGKLYILCGHLCFVCLFFEC